MNNDNTPNIQTTLESEFRFAKPVRYLNIEKSPPMMVPRTAGKRSKKQLQEGIGSLHRMGSRHTQMDFYVLEEKDRFTIYLRDNWQENQQLKAVALATAKLSEKRGIYEIANPAHIPNGQQWISIYDSTIRQLEILFIIKQMRDYLPAQFVEFVQYWAQEIMKPEFMAQEKLGTIASTKAADRERLIVALYTLQTSGIGFNYQLTDFVKDAEDESQWRHYIDTLLNLVMKEPTLRTYNTLLKSLDAPFRIRKSYEPLKTWGVHRCHLKPTATHRQAS